MPNHSIDITLRLISDNPKLDQILALVTALSNQETKIMSALDDLTAEVTTVLGVEASAVALIQGLAAQIAAAGTDPVALANLQAELAASSDALAAAVAANVPPAPPAPDPAP